MNVVPLQQNVYAPVTEFPRNFVPGLLSSCRHRLNTLTEKLQVAVLLDASVAVQVTVVLPIGKQVPDAGLQTTVTPGQLSLAVVVKVTTTHGSLSVAVLTLLDAGQVMVGGCVSLTITAKLQLGPAVLVQVTVVEPFGKNEPEAGEQLTVPQEPVVVGAG